MAKTDGVIETYRNVRNGKVRLRANDQVTRTETAGLISGLSMRHQFEPDGEVFTQGSDSELQ